jgi:hypothetical protein
MRNDVRNIDGHEYARLNNHKLSKEEATHVADKWRNKNPQSKYISHARLIKNKTRGYDVFVHTRKK